MNDDSTPEWQQDKLYASEVAEVGALAERLGVTAEVVAAAIEEHGPMRVDVEAAIERARRAPADGPLELPPDGDDSRWGRADD